jgi:hypothetical protein
MFLKMPLNMKDVKPESWYWCLHCGAVWQGKNLVPFKPGFFEGVWCPGKGCDGGGPDLWPLKSGSYENGKKIPYPGKGAR